MWNKIYPVALAIAVVVMIVLTYLAYSKLQSVGFAPSVIAANYLTFEGYYGQFLWFSALILLILANILMWTQRRSWALWATLSYFVIFLLLKGWWLDKVFFNYQQENSLTDSSLFAGGLISTVLCVFAAVIVYFDQFLVLRLHERMYKSPLAPENDLAEENSLLDEPEEIE